MTDDLARRIWSGSSNVITVWRTSSNALIEECEQRTVECKGCGAAIEVELQMPARQETDQTTNSQQLQTTLDAFGGIYCLDCNGVT